MEYIKVHILDVPYHADCEYTYFVPHSLRENIEIGSMVLVPFGVSNRRKSAVCVGEGKEEKGISAKPVSSVLTEYLKLDGEMLSLCEFMKEQTLCTFGEAVKCIIPSSLIFSTKETYAVLDKDISKMSGDVAEIYSYIEKNPSCDTKKLRENFPDFEKSILYLTRNKYIKKNVEIEEKDKGKYENIITLSLSNDETEEIIDGKGSIKLRSEKHKEILKLLCEYISLSDKEIYDRLGANKTHIDALFKKGLIKLDKKSVFRDPYANFREQSREDIILNEEQQNAFNTLSELYHDKEPKCALLYGITGSGKTSVIKKVIDEAVKDNKGVIILVPEISLTPQTVSVFCGFYGERVAIIHSGLSAGERFDTYKKIKSGEADIVIGTRSAVFAPLKNLGLIVIDEEQEHTYKSETSPKYLAHDIARYRTAKAGSLMLLASATPSLASYYKAMSGVYTLVKLTKRYGEATLPQVIITDMRKERDRGNMSAFGAKLAALLENTLESKKQSILFLNRRGYHSSLSCQKCGEAIECPHCSVAMTYHSYRKITEEITAKNAYEVMSKSGILKCHYCGYQQKVPKKCPKCGEEEINYVGFGTQKAEEDLTKLLPDVKTLRLDADTTGTKSSYENILGSFKDKKADVLIGTQMVTKGHNFPYVTLVGVMLADTMLYTGDFRANERTFAQLTQVIGRAGRAKDKGVAVIQTNSPNDLTIDLAAKQDYEEFYKNEIQIRKAYTFPPFCDIAVITFSSLNETSLNKSGEFIMKKMKEYFNEDTPIMAYGPFEAPIYKTQGKYKKRIMVKCKLTKKVRSIFGQIYADFLKSNTKDTVSIDFNPSN